MQRAQLLADAAFAVRDSGVPVWTTAIPEAGGVLGLFREDAQVLDAAGLPTGATETTIDVLPGMLGSLATGETCSVRPMGPGDALVKRFTVGRGPDARPPDGVLVRYTLSGLRTVAALPETP